MLSININEIGGVLDVIKVEVDLVENEGPVVIEIIVASCVNEARRSRKEKITLGHLQRERAPHK